MVSNALYKRENSFIKTSDGEKCQMQETENIGVLISQLLNAHKEGKATIKLEIEASKLM